MFEEIFGPIEYYEISYELPKKEDLCVIKHDNDVLNMCEKFHCTRLIYVYAVIVKYGDEASHNYLGDDPVFFNYFSDPKHKKLEDDELK